MALTATRLNGRVGFSLRVGGGLSTVAHIAVRLNAFVLPEQVVRVVHAVAELFREQQVLRGKPRPRPPQISFPQGGLDG